jgi:hypothetical protein
MAQVLFADLSGRRYAIPEEVVRAHELVDDIPADEQLTGFEVVPEISGRGADLGYRWDIDGADYVISPPNSTATLAAPSVVSEGSVRVDEPSVVLRISGYDLTVSVTRAGRVVATSRLGPAPTMGDAHDGADGV